ncbi:MAG: collagen-like protein, partial [bacterium]|nr:collagen-like protein [bacterium]
IIASEYYESISIGTITTLEPDQPAYVINSGTNINAILDFGIPRGYTGPQGPKGVRGDDGPRGPKGESGSDGSNGSDGAPGDSSAATISAGIAAGAASASAASAGASAVASASSASSAAASAASAALANAKFQQLEVEVQGLQTQVDTLGEGMTQLDNDVIALKSKTQYMTTGAGITTINSTLNTNDINANNLYVANDLIVVDEVKASSFSGGLLNTNIKGSNINIGTNETLINTIQIGGPTTITTISGIVNYSNPFSNAFFAQW